MLASTSGENEGVAEGWKGGVEERIAQAIFHFIKGRQSLEG